MFTHFPIFFQLDGVPNSRSKKADLVKWLAEKGQDTSGKVVELRQRVKKVLESNPHFRMDQILRERNATILRLPPYHCEVNIICIF